MPVESLPSAGNRDTQDRLLALWYFESELKRIYEAFVAAVVAVTFDTVSAHKLAALKVLASMSLWDCLFYVLYNFGNPVNIVSHY